MTFEELMIRYLDANTAPIEEEELMAQLAVSPEKRAALRDHLRMRDAMARDAASLRPSRALRDDTVALLIATAAATAGAAATAHAATAHEATATAGKGLAHALRGAAARGIALVAAGAAAGTLVTYAVVGGGTPARVESPAPPSQVLLAPQTQSTPPSPTPVTVEPAHPGAPEIRHERIPVPETVHVAVPPTIVHDTVVVAAQPRIISVPPTVTIQRETVYVAPRPRE